MLKFLPERETLKLEALFVARWGTINASSFCLAAAVGEE